MIGVEIVRDQKTKERAPDLRDAIVYRAFTQGPAGAGRRRKYASGSAPPLVIDEEQADFAIRALGESIREAESRVGGGS